jgi:hypothetical protein
MSRHFNEGRTRPIDTQLLLDGVPFNGAGITVTLELLDRQKNVIAEVGTTAWLDASQSTVRYTPSGSDLTFARSPMLAHFKLTSGSVVDSAPVGEGEEWIIHKV